ncbi:MAG: enolase C-terminal domain-like protein [Waddliaceae bacterium]
MKIFYSLYSLEGKPSFTDRSGALLRFVFDDGSMGYADCHPWVELGDLPLSEQLSCLRQGKWTPLTLQSKKHAQIDASGRVEHNNLFDGLHIPSSHWLLTTPIEEIPEGFSSVKIKVGRHSEEEIPTLRDLFQQLPHSVKVRLDFNAKLSQKNFVAYLEKILQWKERIDFIEDPYPYDCRSWEETQHKLGVAFACDRQSEKHQGNTLSHRVSVVKPAVQDAGAFFPTHDLVVTSYLDHPLGQLAAAYHAALMQKTFPGKVLPCGLLSHYAYQTNAFSEQMGRTESVLLPPKGTGFGFDDLLLQQQWTLLACQ